MEKDRLHRSEAPHEHDHSRDEHHLRKERAPHTGGDHGHAHSHLHGEHAAHTGGDHGHAHSHLHGEHASEKRLIVALTLTAGFMLVELFAGIYAHSLALLSDAGHMLADAGALALALVAQRIARRPRTLARTYGFRRAETLAALANASTLVLSAGWVSLEAIARLRHPVTVDGQALLGVATIGLLVNLVSAWVLSRGEGGHNVNTRAALLHVLSDAAGSVAAMVAGVGVVVWGYNRADAVSSLAISVLIFWGAFRLLDAAVSVLMEGAPSGLSLDHLEATIRETPGVSDVHDLHAWTISDGFDAVTVHVVLDGEAHGTEVAEEVGRRVRAQHRVAHVTVQPEAPQSTRLYPAETLVRRNG